MTNNYEKADLLAYQACNLYDKNPVDIDGSFTMYSHDRFSNLIIHGMCEQMLSNGCTEEQIKGVLASKNVRWMLDSKGQELIDLGRRLVNEYKMSETAKGMK